MRWNDEITLISLIDPVERVNEHGFKNPKVEAKTTVYANKKSVGYSEFYKAAQAGYETTLKFDVYKAEYAGQKLAEYGGKRYRILRSYEDPKKPDEVELTLSDLAERGNSDSGAI